MEPGGEGGVSPPMEPYERRFIAALLAGGMLGACATLYAQESTPPGGKEDGGLWQTQVEPADPQEAKREEPPQPRRRADMERELRKIRAEYFRNIRNQQIRQAGITKLRQYTDPVIYPSLLEIFARDGDDVRKAILEHLVDQQNDDADTVVAWAAVFDKDKNYRAMAGEALKHRVALAGGPTPRIKSVVAEGLRRMRDEEVASAAQLAQSLQIAEAIPMLINAQVVARRSNSGGEEGSLAWILVGQQQAFVADLTPVVGPNAVAFDPQLAVATTGTVLRVIDAVVYTYRIEVHTALVGLTSDLWGRSTAHLGWDGKAWAEWYRTEFQPYWAARQAEQRAAAQRREQERARQDRERKPEGPDQGGGG
jgi:hypothetical protein